jgi:hypothetical protein
LGCSIGFGVIRGDIRYQKEFCKRLSRFSKFLEPTDRVRYQRYETDLKLLRCMEGKLKMEERNGVATEENGIKNQQIY